MHKTRFFMEQSQIEWEHTSKPKLIKESKGRMYMVDSGASLHVMMKAYSLSLSSSPQEQGILARVVCSLVCPRADCACSHCACKPGLAHQRSTSSEESPPKTASDWHRGNGSRPRRVQTITRTSRKSTSENGMDLCMLPHARMRPTDASAATPSADSQEVRQRSGTRNAKGRTSSNFPSKRGTATAVARTTLRGDGATPPVERSLPESGASSAAAQPKKRPVSQRQNFAEAVAQERRRVQASLPMESRSQADSEATDVKIDEDSSQDRDKGSSKEVANKLKDLDTLIRQLQPCAQDGGVASLLEEEAGA